MLSQRIMLTLQSGAGLPIFLFMNKRLLAIICTFLLMSMQAIARRASSKDDFRDSVMQRIFAYASTHKLANNSDTSFYAYTKFQMRTNHRNFTLAMVPSMYVVARTAGREFIGEYYSKIKINKKQEVTSKRLLNISTIPHRRNTMPSVLNYLTPNVYNETLFQDNILSPYHRSNKKYYIYSITPLPFGKAQIYVYPRFKNTQLVNSMAIVDYRSGRINLVDFDGEYDMTHFYITVNMNKEDAQRSMYAKKCDLRANFKFMGNQITARYTTVYELPKVIEDTLENAADTALMAKVRPISLNEEEKAIFDNFYKKKNEKDSLSQINNPKKNFVKDFLWDIVGDNVLNRVKQSFGKQNKGYLRINPILNPLYMGYSHRKGFVYKFDIRGSYSFNEDIQLALRLRAGYSFKKHQFYFTIPATFNYNKKHDGYLEVIFGNGNRINSNVVARRVLEISEDKDSLIKFPHGDYTDFKDNYMRVTNHWMITSRFGFELGWVSHTRKAVNPSFYETNNFPSSYRSVAPAFALEWHPIGRRGPVLKADYERSYNNFCGSNISYERMEFDIQGIINSTRRRSLSLRGGAGFYTQKGDHWYFVDYTNFRDNNIPGGWNDDWSGEFEMLNSSWYNASDYYVRSNATFETPALFAAWLPLAGRYIEKERVYVNALMVRKLHPYTEWGYGFTTRLMSIGIFTAFKNTKFDGIGCRFGFELFRNW